jgi:transcriptional regulator with XRE-family HTH domain
MSASDLGAFLRRRRAAARPESLPFATSGQRRVPGLRRDEVAMLASISIEYYTRLEQGREGHPSQQVVAALCQSLGLAPEEARYLHQLADLAWTPAPGNGRDIDGKLLRLMRGWSGSPAFVLDPILDIRAMNRLAADLFDPFRSTDNLVEMVFLDPAARTFYADWPSASESVVARLRASAAHSGERARKRAIVARLIEASPEFGALWARHDVAPMPVALTLDHPTMGELVLDVQAFEIAGEPGSQLVVYHAEPDSISERRIRRRSADQADESAENVA